MATSRATPITDETNLGRTPLPVGDGLAARNLTRPSALLWSDFQGEIDWTDLDVEASVNELRLRCRNGLPHAIAFGYLEDVETMWGIDFEFAEAALRTPQRVEVRPETKEKRYPVLSFHRGDMIVILGMRIPTQPIIIAIYVHPLLEHDTHRSTSGTGGGGAKKASGLPSTVRASVRTLKMLGVELDEETKEHTTEVTFRGQSLGRITMTGATKQQVQSDYQRVVRKVQAIRQREPANA